MCSAYTLQYYTIHTWEIGIPGYYMYDICIPFQGKAPSVLALAYDTGTFLRKDCYRCANYQCLGQLAFSVLKFSF